MSRLIIPLLFFLFIQINPAWSGEIQEIITSDPPGADIYWGKTKRLLMETGLKTPNTRTINADAFESWCYQVKMEGYYDSKVVCRPDEKSNRIVHFQLKSSRPETITETITSDPPGADIYWGKTESKLQKTGLKTPQTRSIQANAWESWCYRVKLEGYHDSNIEFRTEESGDRVIHFTLNPVNMIKEVISSEPSGAYIFWGKSEYHLKYSGFRTPLTRTIEGFAWEPYCYQVKKKGYIDSKIECRPEEIGERKVIFTLSPITQHLLSD
jgi:hypothetical protein